MAGAGYDISGAASSSTSATSGNIGATEFGAGGSNGITTPIILAIVGALLLGFIFFVKFGKKRK